MSGYFRKDQYNSSSQTYEVGLKRPNAWGLYDMSGNVWKWCQDWFGTYPSSPQVDPTGPVSGTRWVVLRGGGWGDIAWYCRSADRYMCDPDGGGYDIGFRVVLSRTQ